MPPPPPPPQQQPAPERESSSSLGYVIAACMLGAAVGNMFVARRLRSFSKVKSPYKENAYTSTSSSSSSSSSSSQQQQQTQQQAHQHRARMSEEEARAEQRFREYRYSQEAKEKVRQQYEAWAKKKMSGVTVDGVDGYMRSQMMALEMDTTKHPTTPDVKAAYRAFALKHHPDRLPPEQKKKAESKFAEATSAYKTLLDMCDKP